MIRNEPYWWEAAPPSMLPETTVLPRCDVCIVGAGYTGLSAGLTLARAGRSVQIFDRMRPGEGASTRNGGIASGSLRHSFAEHEKRFGRERAEGIDREGKLAREDLARFIAEEKIDCDFELTGRFTGASQQKDYESLAREADRLVKVLGIEAHPVSRSEQRQAIGTDFYHGGLVRRDIGGLHPAKLHAGLLRLAHASRCQNTWRDPGPWCPLRRRRLRGRNLARPRPLRPCHRRHQRLHRRRGRLASPTHDPGPQPHHRHSANFRQSDA